MPKSIDRWLGEEERGEFREGKGGGERLLFVICNFKGVSTLQAFMNIRLIVIAFGIHIFNQ